MSSKHVIVRGRVQGVFFRASAEEKAGELGLGGWVRNRDDGAVELVVEGEDEAVDAMVAWARGGPAQASVTEVEVGDVDPQGHVRFVQG